MNMTSKPYKKLWRSRTDRRIAGVCGGLGDYFNIDPFWVRIFFVVFFLVGGAAFIVYIVIWLLVPLEPLGRNKSPIILNSDDAS